MGIYAVLTTAIPKHINEAAAREASNVGHKGIRTVCVGGPTRAWPMSRARHAVSPARCDGAVTTQIRFPRSRALKRGR
ncbi:hypothetical protein AN416_01470 [Paraburkholderia caribensis]|nr:hypothetical protein AN416_01470 [Paraburkholderia caribensis]AUT50489.1 hypothetical protein C2L66_00565 [Paraburkholderia caribensis]